MQHRVPEKAKKSKILIVEDEPIIAGLLCNTVTDFGHDYAGPAFDVRGCLEVLEKLGDEIDAALVDIILGDILAYELCHELDNRGIAFAFATALPRDQIKAPWTKCAHIAKPFKSEEIGAVIRQLVREHDLRG